MEQSDVSRQTGGQTPGLESSPWPKQIFLGTLTGLTIHQAPLDYHRNGRENLEQGMDRPPASEAELAPRGKKIHSAPSTPNVATTEGASYITHGDRRQKSPHCQLSITAYEREHIVLSGSEQDDLYFKLLRSCHSISRLQSQGYRLTVEPPEKSRNEKREEKEVPGAKNYRVEDDGQKPARAKEHQNKPPVKMKPKEKSQWSKDVEPIYFRHTPQSGPEQVYGSRRAVALDCEMVAVLGGQDEVAFLSAVDFFTGEILIHTYVQPTKKVIQWRSSVSGITPAAMSDAVAAGKALAGWRAAQQELWKYAGVNTILVGHCLNHDLNVLRIIHPKVVDSAILSAESVFHEPDVRLRRVWALKTVAQIFLNRTIQWGGRTGHDCLEDAYAARDVVILCLQNPYQLAAWGINARAEHELKMEQLRKEHEARQRKKEKEQGAKEADHQERESMALRQNADKDLETALKDCTGHDLDIEQDPVA
ncbi:ribonuclease H-like domain-containing protein [Aspergillus unguis]